MRGSLRGCAGKPRWTADYGRLGRVSVGADVNFELYHFFLSLGFRPRRINRGWCYQKHAAGEFRVNANGGVTLRCRLGWQADVELFHAFHQVRPVAVLRFERLGVGDQLGCELSRGGEIKTFVVYDGRLGYP